MYVDGLAAWAAPVVGGLGSALTVIAIPWAIDHGLSCVGLKSLSHLGAGFAAVTVLGAISLQCKLWSDWITRAESEAPDSETAAAD